MESDIRLDKYQTAALKAATEGKSIFITGGAGCGKSTLTKEIIKVLSRLHEKVHICGPTWVAAANIGGSSIHSKLFLEPGLESRMEFDEDGNISKDWAVQFLKKPVISSADVLIIDEISMVSGDMLELVNLHINGYDLTRPPFNNAQVIVIGDFSQLPPVSYNTYHYAFQSRIWKKVFSGNEFLLQQQHRQEDNKFIDLLNKIRNGDNYDCFKDSVLPKQLEDKIIEAHPNIVRLCPLRITCFKINQKELDTLKGEEIVCMGFDIKKNGSIDRAIESEKFKGDYLLKLKPGCKIIMTKTIRDVSGIIHNGRTLRFLKLEKIYGTCIFDVIGISGKSAFSGIIKSHRFNSSVRKMIEKKTNMDNILSSLHSAIVEDYITGEQFHIRPELEIRSNNRIIDEVRIQLPFSLGYAITVHKSQGLTMDAVIIYSDNIFGSGMGYTALSRCKYLESLYIIGSLPAHNDTDVEVLLYHEQMEAKNLPS